MVASCDLATGRRSFYIGKYIVNMELIFFFGLTTKTIQTQTQTTHFDAFQQKLLNNL